ncbi:class I SAM-dependent RNA methyltransferase [Acetobacter estunensis]|uniref:Class I SAM-dependent RNA methyltransferase n=1 Tax=Acetobacter estunensis TaxID=104097 RepID=A0A967B6L6_9PROT|nr:class I SAM-dependent RNA methyltransferase [Acetobacter estunensis]NHO53848.1 class I SAM-dependent RNA methyltransferase [Acetobacter estunensis]
MRRKPERRRSRTSPRPDAVLVPPFAWKVEALGSAGDGLARPLDPSNGTDVAFISLTAPGDVVLAQPSAQGRARLVEVMIPAPERVPPPCGLFGVCGGCTLQHLPLSWIQTWKKNRIQDGLQKAGATTLPSISVVATAPSTRRRADLAVRQQGTALVIGLHRRGGDVVDLTECHVLHPDILKLLPPLRDLFPRLDLFRREAELAINLLDTGPDLLIVSKHDASPRDRERLADFARAHGIPRIAGKQPGPKEEPEILAQVGAPRIAFAGVDVEPPPGAFLQASREGEAAIQQAVVAALPRIPGRKAHVVELHAGCGTLTFPLAEHVRVEAYEGHRGATRALQRAATGHRVEAHQRDLDRQPLNTRELGTALAVVLDPPYGGAGLQMQALLDAKPTTLIYVSCNPQMLFRDATRLLACGYTIDAVTVVDQFLWSAEIETVCRFSRKTTR